MSKKIPTTEYCLIKRYLIWCYKTTREELDRIERYFTQNQVDDYILAELIKSEEFQSASGDTDYKKSVQAFEEYKINKFQRAREKKFGEGEELTADYLYLSKRLAAIESAAVHFLGEKEYQQIVEMYEQEMTRRIMAAREHV